MEAPFRIKLNFNAFENRETYASRFHKGVILSAYAIHRNQTHVAKNPFTDSRKHRDPDALHEKEILRVGIFELRWKAFDAQDDE